jgi:signal transduction histidine kinase
LVVEPDPARATGAFDTIAATGRQALVELRRLLGVLRGDGEPAPALLPQPGLDQLDLLLDQVRRAGVPVELVVEGTPVPLPPGVELSAYRIVQEALTNTVKHAGPTRARVLVRYGDDELELRVVDGPDHPQDHPPDGPQADRAGGEVAVDGGHGLLGMRERVSLFGGRLEAGRRPEGGFAVSARLPLGERR